MKYQSLCDSSASAGCGLCARGRASSCWKSADSTRGSYGRAKAGSSLSVARPRELRLLAGGQHLAVLPENLLAAREQLGKSLPRQRRDGHAAGGMRQRPRLLGRAVELVEDQEPRRGGEVQRGEHALHRLRLLLVLRIARVDDVEEKIGLLQLLQRGAESSHQIARQVADEPHGVGDDHFPRMAPAFGRRPLAGKLEPPRGGIEGGEEPPRSQHL